MRRHLFWAAVALALAAAAHAAVVLYLPGWWFAREMAQLSRGHGANTFFILSPAQQAGLFPGLPRGGKLIPELQSEGYFDVRDVPDGRLSNTDHLRVWRATCAGSLPR